MTSHYHKPSSFQQTLPSPFGKDLLKPIHGIIKSAKTGMVAVGGTIEMTKSPSPQPLLFCCGGNFRDFLLRVNPGWLKNSTPPRNRNHLSDSTEILLGIVSRTRRQPVGWPDPSDCCQGITPKFIASVTLWVADSTKRSSISVSSLGEKALHVQRQKG